LFINNIYRQCTNNFVAATFTWNQRTGATGVVVTSDLGISGNLFNFQNQDVASAAQYASYPVTAGNNSYDVYLRPHFSGSFNKIQNIQFWKSSGAEGAGEALYWKDGGANAYAAPATTTDGTDAVVPTADPGSSNVGINSSQASSLSAAGYSDYIVLQIRTTTAAEAGDTEVFTWTLQYDEN
jgi:hypothetical protein